MNFTFLLLLAKYYLQKLGQESAPGIIVFKYSSKFSSNSQACEIDPLYGHIIIGPLYGCIIIDPLYGRIIIGPLYGCIIIGPLYGCIIIGPLYGCIIIGPLYGCIIIGPLYGCIIIGPLYGCITKEQIQCYSNVSDLLRLSLDCMFPIL